MSAAFSGSLTAARVLSDRGADPGLRNDDGQTARDLAEDMGWSALADLLAIE